MSISKKEPKVYLIRELLQDKKLTNIEALLLSKLIDLSRIRFKQIPEDGFICRPTNKFLGEIVKLKGFTIQKYLSELCEKGYIKFSTDFEFYENLYHKQHFEFTESKTREIIVINPVEYKNIFEINRKYLLKFKHKEAITFSYMDNIRKIPRYKIKKSTIAKAMGVYNFQSIRQRLYDYPNLDRIEKFHVYLKGPP